MVARDGVEPLTPAFSDGRKEQMLMATERFSAHGITAHGTLVAPIAGE